MLKGKISINRPSYSDIDHPEVITIELTDATSGCRFLEVEIGVAEFAKALTGLSYTDCEFELNAKNVGKVHEHQVVIVPVDSSYVPHGMREKIAARILKPFEVDGWKGQVDDLFNHHRYTPKGQRVTFHRYVEKTLDKNKEKV